MLLAEVPDSGRLAHWLDAHPPLQARIAKVYGRAMPAMALQQDEQSP
jgi:heat shock protein HtpX